MVGSTERIGRLSPSVSHSATPRLNSAINVVQGAHNALGASAFLPGANEGPLLVPLACPYPPRCAHGKCAMSKSYSFPKEEAQSG